MKIKGDYVFVFVLYVLWILLMVLTDPPDFETKLKVTIAILVGLAFIIWRLVKRKKDSKKGKVNHEKAKITK